MILGSFEAGLILHLLLGWYGYQTYLTVESQEWRLNNNWLLFWMLYAAFQLVEFLPDLLLGWFPFYYEAKVGLFVYLGLFGGAVKLYDAVLKKTVFDKVHQQVGKVMANPSLQKANSLLRDKTGVSLPCVSGASSAAGSGLSSAYTQLPPLGSSHGASAQAYPSGAPGGSAAAPSGGTYLFTA
eukprot:RCo036012